MNARPYITCKQLLDFILDYIEGSLPEQERSDFDRHLAVCPSCVAYLDSYRKTIKLGANSFASSDESAQGFAPDALLEAIRKARSQ